MLRAGEQYLAGPATKGAVAHDDDDDVLQVAADGLRQRAVEAGVEEDGVVEEEGEDAAARQHELEGRLVDVRERHHALQLARQVRPRKTALAAS